MISLVGMLFGTMDSSARQIADFFNSGLLLTQAGEKVEVSLSTVMNVSAAHKLWRHMTTR